MKTGRRKWYGVVVLALVATGALARPPKRATVKPPRKSVETEAAERVADGIVQVLKGAGRFRVDGCPPVTPTEWASLLLLNDGIPMKYAFTEGCDVEGDAVLRRDPFPLDLKLRNFPSGDRLKATVDAEAKPDWAQGIVRAEVRFRDGTLEGGKHGAPVAFTAALRVATGLDASRPSPVAGEIRVYRFRGQPVDVRRSFP